MIHVELIISLHYAKFQIESASSYARTQPDRLLRHHPPRRRTVSRLHHASRGEAPHGPPAGSPRRRRPRSRLRHRLRRRLQRRPRHRPRGQGHPHRLPRPLQTRRHRGSRPRRRARCEQPHPYLPRLLRPSSRIQTPHHPRAGPRTGSRVRPPRPYLLRRRRVLHRVQHPHRPRVPPQDDHHRRPGRSHHHQHPRHRRLHHARGVRRHLPHGQSPRPWHRQRRPLHPLPQRPRYGRRKLHRRHPGWSPPGRVHHQRHRRTRRQRRSRGDRRHPHGPPRQAPLHPPHRHGPALPHQPDARRSHQLRLLAQQGRRRSQRLRPRVRHSPARHDGEPAHLRDHDASLRGSSQHQSCPRQTLRPPRPRRSPRKARPPPHSRAARRRLPPLHRARRPQEIHLRPGPPRSPSARQVHRHHALKSKSKGIK